MYYKEVNGRTIFSTCKTICLEYDHPPLVKGQWVSNPDSQLVYDDGWLPYTPPIVPPQPAMEPEDGEMLEAIKRMLSTETEALSDEDALAVAALYPTWASKIDTEVAAGERLWYDGKLYKVIQGHTVSALWVPDHNPALYAEVSIEEWPEWKQPLGSEDAYQKGDRVSHNAKHWESTMDANVYEPGVYGWEEKQ